MANIESPFWLWIKGGLFVAIGCLCLVFVAMVTQSVQLVAVCCLAIWAFCRAYYFAFYVIENYIDPKFRFAGLLSVLGYHGNRTLISEWSNDCSRRLGGYPTFG